MRRDLFLVLHIYDGRTKEQLGYPPSCLVHHKVLILFDCTGLDLGMVHCEDERRGRDDNSKCYVTEFDHFTEGNKILLVSTST
jgi:hypothetical protein